MTAEVIQLRPTAKTGRRRKPNPRSEIVSLRLTADESLAIRLAAEREGMTVGDWLRAKARAALLPEPK